jgi:hypothetical protein
VYNDTRIPVPNIPSKSRDWADENTKFLMEWCTDNCILKIKFVLFLYSLLSASWKEYDLSWYISVIRQSRRKYKVFDGMQMIQNNHIDKILILLCFGVFNRNLSHFAINSYEQEVKLSSMWWSLGQILSMSLSLSPNSLYRQTTDGTEGGGLTREHCIPI